MRAEEAAEAAAPLLGGGCSGGAGQAFSVVHRRVSATGAEEPSRKQPVLLENLLFFRKRMTAGPGVVLCLRGHAPHV